MSGYLLASQGDRMLMANSVEGRFPYLDPRLVRLADSLPPAYKLLGLDEKHILKRIASGLVPDEIVRRPKQPYRAPDATSFLGPDRPAWIDHVVSPRFVAEAGIFDVDAVHRLWRKCLMTDRGDQLSTGDNMALVGVLSTGLLYEGFVNSTPASRPPVPFETVADRVLGEVRG